MAASHFMVAAAVTAALTGTATAQTTVSSNATPSAQVSTSATTAGATRSHWLASGFLGTSLNTTTRNTELIANKDEHRLGYGGQAGYLWRGVLGGEFVADFSPTSESNGLSPLLDRNGSVNAYMGNVVGAYPLGSKGQYQPYASGGWGRISLAADVFNQAGNPESGTDRLNEGRSGTNIGGGLMAFANHVGVRTDLRWYRSSTNEITIADTDPGTVLEAQELLTGLEFWRFNGGLAFRW
jgi:hypothetical protein